MWKGVDGFRMVKREDVRWDDCVRDVSGLVSMPDGDLDVGMGEEGHGGYLKGAKGSSLCRS